MFSLMLCGGLSLGLWLCAVRPRPVRARAAQARGHRSRATRTPPRPDVPP